jgi:hypothetical protein
LSILGACSGIHSCPEIPTQCREYPFKNPLSSQFLKSSSQNLGTTSVLHRESAARPAVSILLRTPFHSKFNYLF